LQLRTLFEIRDVETAQIAIPRAWTAISSETSPRSTPAERETRADDSTAATNRAASATMSGLSICAALGWIDRRSTCCRRVAANSRG